MQVPNAEKILQKYFAQANGKQIIAHQIESFNQFIEYDIPDIIHRANPIIVRGSPEVPLSGPRLSTAVANAVMGSEAIAGPRHEYDIQMEFLDVHMRKPTIFENNGSVLPMMPNDARLRTLTYAAPLHVDVKVSVTFIDNTQGGMRETRTRIFPNVHLGKIPVMVGSKFCLLADQAHVHHSQLGECSEDMGGYFIIQGGERVIISQERMSENRPFVFRNNKNPAKEIEVIEIKSIGPDNDQSPKTNSVKLMYHPKNSQIHLLRAILPRIKADIPITILFRALGVLADKDIYDMIVEPGESLFDSIMMDSMEEGSNILTQDAAIEWISQFVTTWTPKTNKSNLVRDILANDFFPHMGGGDKLYEKACFLANMTKKLLWVTVKRLPVDDRDGYSNKRVDLPGFLMASLFRTYFVNKMLKDIKMSLSKEITGGAWKTSHAFEDIVNVSNIHKIIKSTIMDTGLKTSLATGNFSASKLGGASKIGVSQVMNRLNYAAGISHLRRVSTPIEKTAGKLLEPRKLHNSQFGYICVTRDTNILCGDGITSVAIGDMKNGDNVLTADPNTLEESPSEIYNYFKITPSRVIKIKTLSGRTIGCSPDHPILVARDDENVWIHAGDLVVGDRVIVKNYTCPLATDDGEEALVVTLEQIKDIDDSPKRCGDLKSYIGCEISEENKQILARLLGASLTDGTIGRHGEYGYTASFYVGEESDAKAIVDDIKRLGFGDINYRKKTSVYNGENTTVTYNYYDVGKGGAFATFLIAIGGIVGNKGKYNNPVVPGWIKNGSSSVKREFLSGFQGGDGCYIHGNMAVMGHSKLQIGRTQQTCSSEYAESHGAYMNDIVNLFRDLDVDANLITEDCGDKTIHHIRISSAIDNICTYATKIGYRYCAEKTRKSALFIEYALYKNMFLKEKESIVERVRNLRKTGMQLNHIHDAIDKKMSIESIRRFINDENKVVVKNIDHMSLHKFNDAVGIISDKIVMPIIEITDIPVEDVYDFTTKSDNHDFYANGILVRNCPAETPEGAGVGVVKNMSSNSHVTIWTPPIRIHKFLKDLDGIKLLRDASSEDTHKHIRCFINGAWYAVIDSDTVLMVIDELRKAKRAGKIHIFTGIIWKPKLRELWISTEAGRIIRPVYYAPALREACADPALIEEINNCPSWDELLLWESPSGRHLIEYIDPGESDGVYMAINTEKALEDVNTTHAEIHPCTVLGTTASFIPFPDHNQSPRNAYQSSMGKQAMGVYALNYRERFDAQAHILCYPQKPLVTPYLSRVYGINKMPAGQNIIVAIMTYSGYNQEDSVMINRASLERGLFRSIFYRTYKDEEKKNQSSGEEEKFCKPDTELTKHIKYANYDKLGANGFVPENTYVTSNDILIGKTVPIRVATGQVLPAGTKRFKDVSKTLRNNEVGYVDRIYTSRNGEGYSFVKIRVRQDRIPEIGDKFCLTADHDVLTQTRGWVPIADVTTEDQVAQLNRSTGTMEYVNPIETLVFDQDGDMYEVESQGVSLKTTLNHRMWVQKRDESEYSLVEAKDIIGKRVRYQCDGPVSREDLEITIGAETFNEEKMDALINIYGIWFAEGWTYIKPKDYINRLEFAANKERVEKKLIESCNILGWNYNYVKSTKKFYINNKDIAYDLAVHNVGATNKSLPTWVFNLSSRQSKLFIQAMCLGDGYETATSLHYYTSSIKLRDELQILCQHAGWTSYYVKQYDAGHQTTLKDGRVITSTVDNWNIGIRRKRLRPTMNHGHANEQNGQIEELTPYTGKVYCLRVPTEVFLVRRHGRIVWTGNSSRHGQKGTMGMILNPEDMPQTADGIKPDIIVNPHAIPSRMTIAQLMETLMGKMGCMAGTYGDGSPFNNITVEGLANTMRDKYGLEPYGNDILYNGHTGKQMETSIFIGPCFYQRLRHCSADKIHSRASGPLVMLTRQPAEGRARDGGLRFGRHICQKVRD